MMLGREEGSRCLSGVLLHFPMKKPLENSRLAVLHYECNREIMR